MEHTQTGNAEATLVRGALALELIGGTQPQHAALGRGQAGALAEKLARDLAALVPGVRRLNLHLAAAHFDPAEALRPGWPLHRRLDELGARAPGQADGPRIIVFGADTAGEVPLPFKADKDLVGGALRIVPFLLSGDASVISEVGDALEEVLLERGMAQPDTALLAQEAFGAQIEHSRYMTAHDLAAMMAMQYQNLGLQRLWPVIETALLQPELEEWLDQPPEPLLRYAEGEVRIALMDPQAWQQRHANHVSGDAERLTRAYGYYQARQRQLAAVLEAHGLPVIFVHCPAEADPKVALQA